MVGSSRMGTQENREMNFVVLISNIDMWGVFTLVTFFPHAAIVNNNVWFSF
jgi:hypothetical protein